MSCRRGKRAVERAMICFWGMGEVSPEVPGLENRSRSCSETRSSHPPSGEIDVPVFLFDYLNVDP